MYEIAKKARAGMKSKAERLAGEKDRKTDSSDWSPAEPLNADVKTGMRPVSRRAYKSGGKVDGCAAPMRADRKPRKAGGRVETKGEQPLVDRYVNRDLKKANEYRDGTKHVGALKHGGRAKKADGGYMSMEEMIKKNPAPVKKPLGLDKVPLPPRRPANLTTAVPNEKYKKDTDLNTQSYKKGGRIKRSDGGEAIDKRLAEYKEFQERLKKEREDFSNEQERKYPGKSFWERVDADLKEKFSPAFFADLKAQRKKELAGNKDYQEFAARRAKKSDDDSDDKMKKGGRVAKASGGGTGKSFWGSPEFKSAFRAARNAYLSGEGPKNFEFQGKSYSTDLMKVPTPPSRPRPVQEKVLSVEFGPAKSKMPEVNQMGDATGGGMKKGGRIKKEDGGGMDPRLGIVSPKAFNFAQNLVTPGLKKGGRAKKEVGGPAIEAGKAATAALSNPPAVGPSPSASNVPPVSSGLLPQPKGNYVKPPVYDPDKYNKPTKGKFGGLGPLSDYFNRFKNPTTAKKGGRIKKQIGGALSGSMPAAAGTSVRQAMPQVGTGMMGRGPSPQAFANAQGRPFQGGQFMPPGLAKRMPQLPPQGMANLVTNPATPINANPNPPTMYPGGNPNFNEGGVYNLTPPTLGGVASMPAPLNAATPVSGGVASMPAPLNAPQARSYGSGTIGSGAYAKGGRVARASGGSAKSKGKGKTNINIIIAAGKKEPQSMIPNVPQAPMGMPPMQQPNMPAAAPMGAGAPPMPMSPLGAGQPPMPGAFKQGGRVSKVARSFKDMTAGAGSGEGRLQKTDIAKRAPHKAGGKVYRSYKDMDAGSGSGKGRLEKTEIQSRKR